MTHIFSLCALWPWPWKHDLSSRSWHTLGSWTISDWKIIQIKLGSEELCPWHGFWLCVHCDLDDKLWPLVKVLTHPWVMDINCVKYYQDRTGGYEVMVQTPCEQTYGKTDGQTGWFRVELVVQFPVRGSTHLFLVCCGCDTSYIVSVHIQCQASIYTLLLCRGHSWRVQLAKQETLTPPGHLVSPLVCRGPWMSTVVLYCWCHSDRASVLL